MSVQNACSQTAPRCSLGWMPHAGLSPKCSATLQLGLALPALRRGLPPGWWGQSKPWGPGWESCTYRDLWALRRPGHGRPEPSLQGAEKGLASGTTGWEEALCRPRRSPGCAEDLPRRGGPSGLCSMEGLNKGAHGTWGERSRNLLATDRGAGEGTILNRVNAEVTVQKGTGRRVHRLSSPSPHRPCSPQTPHGATRSEKQRHKKIIGQLNEAKNAPHCVPNKSYCPRGEAVLGTLKFLMETPGDDSSRGRLGPPGSDLSARCCPLPSD